MERLASWLANRIFTETMKDERADAYMRGFSQGYGLGRKHERDLNDLAMRITGNWTVEEKNEKGTSYTTLNDLAN